MSGPQDVSGMSSPGVTSAVREHCKVLCQEGDILGEGPLWDHRSDSLLWIDILRGKVHCWSASRGVQTLVEMDALIGSIALAGQADLLLATSMGLFRHHAAVGETRLLANPIEGRPVRFNDGRVDARGRFWIGTMALDPEHYGKSWGELYRFDCDGTIQLMEQGLTISNGLDWSLDGKTMYLTDTMRRVIYAYAFDLSTGTIGNREVFVRTAEQDGYPDGLVVDADGFVWSAGFGGNAICRYDAKGQYVERVRLPVSCPTALTFGGAAYSVAFLTTSRHVLPNDHHQKDAGAVFSMALGVAGRPAMAFGSGELQ